MPPVSPVPAEGPLQPGRLANPRATFAHPGAWFSHLETLVPFSFL
jgi:hypothetical protein